VKGDHFLDTNILVAWLVHYDHHRGVTSPYFKHKATRHSSELVVTEVLGILGRYRKTAGDLVSNLEASKDTIGAQNWLVRAVRLTETALAATDRSRVKRLVQGYHGRIVEYQAGKLTADALLAEMTAPLHAGVSLLRKQNICTLHPVPRDVTSRYGPVADALAKVVRNQADVRVVLGAHHLRLGGIPIAPFITVDGTDFLQNHQSDLLHRSSGCRPTSRSRKGLKVATPG
jgi:predicted nucleic acid-binding protein